MSDYISREAARPDAFCEGVSCQECPFCKDPIKGGCRVDDYIKDIPAADVRPVVRGKWIEHGRDRPPTCSNCGSGCLLNYESDYHKSDYCPHCGADMREEIDHD